MRLIAEWEPQDGVLLAWPHEATDWKPHLEDAQRNFAEIAAAISKTERVVVVGGDPISALSTIRAANATMENIKHYELPTNDTWARDFGPITVELPGGARKILDFGFNGWGLKYAANHDNQVTRKLGTSSVFGATVIETVGLILEGGSLETDGQGTLLTTSECLLNCNRNPHLTKEGLQHELNKWLGIDHFLWLDHGALVGDDTDSHIDTLARLCPDDTILYVRCDDPDDEQYAGLNAMKLQLESFRTKAGGRFRLISLPSPSAKRNAEGRRLPATYANFLITNGAVLVPTYEDDRDHEAIFAISSAFPDRQVVGINCNSLILQYGSLHCVTMQLPQGVLASEWDRS